MLEPGLRIGPYAITGLLGAGGMGEVYRARDTTLGRDVALKTLPAAVAHDPTALARLRREARVLASLSHPGIATLYGLEESGEAPVLAMELVEGETLSDRLRHGPLSLQESLRVGEQVAAAVAAAHAKGVLHRDLKPANIRLTPEGRAKVLDFGLARAFVDEAAALDSRITTATPPLSAVGTVLGTAPYMSPEQVRGQKVDSRTDVWAFGCLLYEVLSGRRAFPGTTLPEVTAAILEREPDWHALPAATPSALERLLRRCLRREMDERLRDIGDAGLELKELSLELSPGAFSDGSASRRAGSLRAGRRKRAWFAAAAAAVLVVSAGIVSLVRGRRAPAPADSRGPRFDLSLPRGAALLDLEWAQSALALSPDGRKTAFVGCVQGACEIYLRDHHELDPRPISGTQGGQSPFFSPDGRWLGFFVRGKLKKVALDGGAVVSLTDTPHFRGASWSEDGTILFSPGAGGLLRVSAEGGEPQVVTTPDGRRNETSHRWPRVVPGAHAALFDVTRGGGDRHDVAVVDLATGRTRTLVERACYPRWAPSGHLLFGRSGVVFAALLDPRRLKLDGPALPVLEGVAMWDSPGIRSWSGCAYYDVAPDGTLIFSPRESRLPRRTLVWVDRAGQRTAASGQCQTYQTLRLSPDGRRLAVSVRTDPDAQDVFLLDIERDAWTKVTFGKEGLAYAGNTDLASWMPDGLGLLLGSTREGRPQLLLGRADGTDPPEVLREGESQLAVPAPDGTAVLFCAQSAPAQIDIWRLPLHGRRVAEPFVATPSVDVSPSFSPDGRWVAYRSDESGREEIYVQPYPGPGPRHMVSTQGGDVPLWSRDGREIFFGLQRGALASSAVRARPTFTSDPPRRLFDLPPEILYDFSTYDVTPDGQRFVMIERDPFELRPLGIVVVPAWTSELTGRLATAGKASRQLIGN